MVAPGACSTERYGIPALSGRAASVSLDRVQAVEGGVSRLLADLRRDNPALYEHSLQVWALTRRLAVSLLTNHEERATVELAALLHDVGKLILPRTLLDKPTSLTPQEYLAIQQHCAAGAHLLQQMQVDDCVIKLVYHHHERWDGQGYPQRLAGPAIPRGSRLIAIADAIAAMTTPRPYQGARSVPVALKELERCAGTQFDPLLVQQYTESLQAMKHGITGLYCWAVCHCADDFAKIGRTLKLPDATAKTYFQRAKPHLRRLLVGVRDYN